MYRIAELLVDIPTRYAYFPHMAAPYRCEDGAADITVTVSREDIDAERARGESDGTDGYFEAVAAHRKFCDQLPRYDAFLLHSSAITVKGHGVAFLADSGVGKSTHTALWKQQFGDRLTVVNGDKPVVRFFGGAPYICGTPWCGKEGWQTNTRARLTDLCVIERSTVNCTEPITAQQMVRALMPQVITPRTPEDAEKLLTMLDALIGQCRLWRIRCNMSPQAAQVAADMILKG